MNFLKKHYEKAILFALFVIFAVLLVHLYFIVQSTKKVEDRHLQIPSRDPDYVVADIKAEEFNFQKLFSKNLSISKTAARDGKNSVDFSDLISIFRISRCGHCKFLIPRRIMEQGSACPLCKKGLLPPKAEERGAKVAARLDSDEDGIPNVVELLFDLNPYDASDALYDLDDDGFVNVYEYLELQNTEEFKKIFSDEFKNISADEIKNMALKNPKIHPELANGLYLEKIDRQKLNAYLLGVSVIENRSKEFWNIQMDIKPHPTDNSRRRRRRRLSRVGSAFLEIGQKLYLTTGVYTIHDIRRDTEAAKTAAKTVKNDDKQKDLDTSYYVILKDSKNRDVIMKVGSETYDLEHEAFFKDVWGYRSYSGKVGDTIRMGNSKIDYTRYKIKAINKSNESVTLEPPGKGVKDIVIGRKAKMPVEFIPSKEKKEEGKNAAEGEKK